ncbi:unnamed protein product [Bursaphelenchus xylophilus]|uniref:(pine wood nematode) hypothetical protein n=1 Tax=Bursaphelenchus xylophilus TaxID=6326 RepID=A0A1I7S2S9_BURXY|nr:unnamed protein product [Bursaphelenchus xylophilus]CAG9121652.1 unnamed protein product [Bursaphelenchus xylophilus]
MPIKGAKFIVLSVVVTIFIAICTTVANQLAKTALSEDPENFSAPFFLAYFGTLMMIPLYPAYLLIKVIFSKESVAKINENALKVVENKDGKLYPELTLLLGSAISVALWTGPPFLFGISVQYISVSAATAIGSLSAAMVFVFSILWLDAQFCFFKAGGIVVSIVGVVILSMDGQFTGSVFGVCLILIWALLTAIYTTAFKKAFGDLSLGQVLFYQTLLGLSNFIWNTIPMFFMGYLDYDRINWSSVPWLPVLGNALAGCAFSVGANFGIALLNPLVVSIAFLVGIPMNAAVDIIFRGLPAGIKAYIGGFFILGGFCLTSLPFDEWSKKFISKYRNPNP